MEAFQILAEVSVAIAGFSSLAIVFRGQISKWQGQDYVSLAFAMCWAIGAVFFSLFPIIMEEFGFSLARSSQIGLFVLAAFMLLVGSSLQFIRTRVETAGGGMTKLSPVLSVLYLIILIGAVAAGTGALPGATNGWYATAITLLMAHATGELGILVIDAVKQGGDE